MSLTFDTSFQKELAVESWTLYAFGMIFILLRMFSRLRRGGIRAFTVDDYLMIGAAFLYTGLIVCLNVIASGGGSNLYEPDEYSTFTPEDIRERIKGSKIVVVSEQAMLNLIYVLKACMICIYGRLTKQLKHAVFVKALAIYSICGYVGSQLAFFLACRPFKGYWAVPPPNPQCTTLQHYAITQACFNTTSDALMLAISIPLLLSTTLPIKQKIVLVAVFGMGIFVVLAAILTKVFNLRDPYSTVYMLWYTREASVAVYVVNLPLIWPLLRETFPFLRSFTPGGKYYSGSKSRWKGITTSRNQRLPTGSNNNTGNGGSNEARSKVSTNISVIERGLDSIRMDTLRRKRDADSVSMDSEELALNLGGINQETTVNVEVTSMHGSETGMCNGNGIALEGWHETTYHANVRGGAHHQNSSDVGDPDSEVERFEK